MSCLSSGSLQSWGAQCVVHTFCFSGRRWGLESPPDCESPLWGGGDFAEFDSASPTHFDEFSFSLTCYAGAAQLGFFFFLRGYCSICSTDSVCLWTEVSSGSSYIVILNQNSHSYFKWIKIWVLQNFQEHSLYSSMVGLHQIYWGESWSQLFYASSLQVI